MDTPDAPYWSALDDGATLLTASARLAGWLRAGYDQRQQAAGRRAWATPEIYALGAWLERAWAQASTHAAAPAGTALLLTAAQEQWLWEDIIARAADGEPGAALLDLGGAARAAAAAWRLAQGWQLDWADTAWEQSEDTAAFRSWARELARRCREAGWITAAELPEAVGGRTRRGETAAPKRVMLAGFDEQTPRQAALFAALSGAGSDIAEAGPERAPAPMALLAAADTEEELRRAAAWARERLERAAELGAAPNIAVIVPGLEAQRAAVERIFTAALHPGRTPWSERPRSFHISLGLPLERWPVVAAALDWLEALEADRDGLEMEAVGELLRSPFIEGADTEKAARAAWEVTLRRAQRTHMGWGELLAANPTCPRWQAAARRARSARGTGLRVRSSYTAWAESFAAWLEALGWPGERPLGSGEYQTVKAWTEALGELGRLDQVAGSTIAAGTALRRLRRIAAARIFQPQETAAPVQIMGWLEAAGLEFDALWVMGLDDQTLPAAAAPHPFIPLRWQRELGLPHASAAREKAFAGQVLERLRRSAAAVVVSYPTRDGEAELRPSPLLADATPWLEAAPAPVPMVVAAVEPIPDGAGPAVGVTEAIRGGTRIFTDQAACPFRAFAHLRLHAVGMEAVPAGLATTTQGTLLHRVLEKVWAELGTQAALLAMPATELETLVAAHADAVVVAEPLLERRPGLAALERQRLMRLTLEWLEKEKDREPFRVLSREEKRDTTFAGVRLELKPDRVDALAGGGRMLIDYKSGKTSKGDWEGERPNQPQLPLYLAADPDSASIAAIAFAQLRPGELSFKAVAERKGIVPQAKTPESWEQQVGAWQHTLEALARDFLLGQAAVNPKDPGKTCAVCDLQILCRVTELVRDRRPAAPEVFVAAKEDDAN